MLNLENIHISFIHHGNQIDVLSGIDLVVNSGDSLAITGASGVGKSTLLNIMGALTPPTKGLVRFRDQNLSKMDGASLSRFRNREIGFVFQFHHLLPELNALENTMMPALIARHSRKSASGTAKEILEKVGLEKRLTHRAGELSGGEQQRVAIARALIMKPKLLLADEPTGNLDWLTGQGIADLLMRLNKEERVAIVIATHNHRLAEKMSKRMEIASGQIK
ncbi:MAG: ABC transporter ATP-binding protein [Desulfobacterales bacterium]|nr:ABC transporter ATP-binding protein [Desulfobacterales bacterium]